MGCTAADRKTTPELLISLCHEAILRELRWLLLPNPYIRPDLTSNDFHWFGLFTDPLRGRKFGCESELNEVIKGMSKRMVLDLKIFTENEKI